MTKRSEIERLRLRLARVEPIARAYLDQFTTSLDGRRRDQLGNRLPPEWEETERLLRGSVV